MTTKLFWNDPYRTELDTRIAAVRGDEVAVEETIFYAFSGGQESDRGTLGNHAVLSARKANLDIFYTLESGHGLQFGDPVRMTIDGERRYRLMRLHFAAEIVLELVCRCDATATKIGAHIAADKARIDFRTDTGIARLLPEIQRQAMEIVDADREIISTYSDRAAQRRYWEIPGFARVECGGTHPRRTAEVGAIELKRRNPGKGKERIEIRLAESDRLEPEIPLVSCVTDDSG